MDNWGDPWADNARSPTKGAVTSPLPPTVAPAPTLLNGFLDDAGWGNEDESFGDWSTAPPKEEHNASCTTAPIIDTFTDKHIGHASDDADWTAIREGDRVEEHDRSGWEDVTQDARKDEEQVFSETSDSSTTIQDADITADGLRTATAALRPDDESSARTSTSPSEASHNDVPAESPRTSYEDEKAGASDARSHEEKVPLSSTSPPDDVVAISSTGDTKENRLDHTSSSGDNNERVESVHSASDNTSRSLNSHESTDSPSSEVPIVSDIGSNISPQAFLTDPNLLNKLFVPLNDTKPLNEPPNDPIYSTASRKAWYRLTRRQTLREFNHGDDDDNYIRITWVNSGIRSEVNNIVGRWAREDRISGTGPGARASFYWDSPAPVEPPMHVRQQSSVSTASQIVSSHVNNPSLSTNAPVAFDWSSASKPMDPWQQASPGLRSSSSPIAPPILSSMNTVRKQDARAASLDLTSHRPGSAKHARNLTVAHETPTVANSISPPILTMAAAPTSDPWAGLDNLETHSAQNTLPSVATDDSEEEWGEMVSTPTVSTPSLTRPTSQVELRDDTDSNTTTPPQLVKSAAFRDQSPDAMHATTIVRLKSTISPTSAYFKAKSFVPLGIEQGPIGPGILKSAKRPVSVAPKAFEQTSNSPVEQDRAQSAVSNDKFDPSLPAGFSERQTPAPSVLEKEEPKSPKALSPVVQEVARSITPHDPVPASTESSIDAWADADFSFFESALPTVPLSQSIADTPDPFSVLEGRQRSVSVASSAKTYTRSPPRKIPTPPIQPLTGATSSAQRRKTEEEAIIRDILRGLPDLRYMLN